MANPIIVKGSLSDEAWGRREGDFRPACDRCGDRFPGGSGRFCSVLCWMLFFGCYGND